MLGPTKRRDEPLFYCGFSLEERVPGDHALRAIRAAVDFTFVRREVAPLYGIRGHESVDPTVVLKLLFLKYLYQVPSTRQLMRDLPMRLDWLWFCEFDLTDTIPDHSVVSKAKRRWGRAVFVGFFRRVVQACVEAGLVDGSTVHADASVNAANASMESLQTRLNLIGESIYDEDAQTEGDEGSPATKSDEVSPPPPPPPPPPGTRVSSTDPEARLTEKNGRAVLGYKDHRVVDDRCGIITATVTTPADVSEPHVLGEALEQHERNTGRTVETVCADKQYGTAANYRMLHDSRVTPCIPHKRVREDPTKLPRRLFVYDPAQDRYTCPAGRHLTRRARSDGNRWRYAAARGVCAGCALKACCTDAARGRTISRQVDQEMIDWADGALSPRQRKRLMGRRKSKMEGSFADAAARHGSKRMRWRGLLNATVQHLLIATIQNLRKLIKATRRSRSPALAQRAGRQPTLLRCEGRQPTTPLVGQGATAATRLAVGALKRLFPPRQLADAPCCLN